MDYAVDANQPERQQQGRDGNWYRHSEVNRYRVNDQHKAEQDAEHTPDWRGFSPLLEQRLRIGGDSSHVCVAWPENLRKNILTLSERAGTALICHCKR